ncbi:MAG: N-acetylmuramoyl-L-alanine amidase [Actinomycetia bacterium]|nr:N-acetylmuramoyl-L-alanine amidase [Actinomycetes bacterium]
MADPEPKPPGEHAPIELSRRQVLGLGAAAASVAATTSLLAVPPVGARPRASMAASAQTSEADQLRPTIRPRSDWAGELAVKGELIPEDDVRFLLVHHTASTNDYGPDQVVDQIRGFYDFHTGPDKGWPDVAYNFFVDRYGGIWEGRQGSVAGPIRGDATGGSQGFALLCSLIGNHHDQPVTAETQASLVSLLAWLGATYGVDTTAGSMTTFTSRGSSRWPAGTEVTARTISGHRDMSTTTCPGDFAYPLLAEDIPDAVSAVRAAAASGSTSSTSSTSTTEAASSSAPTSNPAANDPTTVTADGSGPTSSAPATGPEPATAGSSEALGATSAAEEGDRSWPLVIAGGALAVVAAGVAAISRFLPSSKGNT